MNCRAKLYLCNNHNIRFFGKGPSLLLQLVEKTGSLNQAANQLGMSYNKALRLIKNAEQALNDKLLESEAGGLNGGGSKLTKTGKAFLSKYCSFESEAQQALKVCFEKYFKEAPQ